MKYMHKFLARVIALGALLSASDAFAVKIETILGSNIDDAPPISLSRTGKYRIGTYAYETGSGYFYVQSGSFYAAGDINNQNSTVVTEQVTTYEAVSAQMNIIQAHLDGSTTGAIAPTGGNGGAHGKRWSILARVHWTNIKEDIPGAAWKGDLYSFALGADYTFNDILTLGLALTYGYLDGDTSFNRGAIRDHAYGVVPFARIQANKWLSFDVMGGYNYVTKNRSRVLQFNDLTVNNGLGVSGNPHSDRWFGAIFANLTYRINRLNLLGRAGYSYMSDDQKAFTENNNDRYTSQKININSGYVRLQLGYNVTRMFEPFLFGLYEHHSATKVDGSLYQSAVINSTRSRDLFGGGLGINVRANNNLSGGLEYSYKQAKDLKVHDVGLKIKYEF
jgi:outer membrane autotransporter protein